MRTPRVTFMGRLDRTKAAIVDHLRHLKAAPQYPVDLYDIGVPLSKSGFTPDELYMALRSLERDGVIELISHARLLVTKPFD
jgi:hypothetical protein